jgi:hypothetical protein
VPRWPAVQEGWEESMSRLIAVVFALLWPRIRSLASGGAALRLGVSRVADAEIKIGQTYPVGKL